MGQINDEMLAFVLFDKGAIQFGEFKLKLHETNPDAPLSPFFANIRDKNNPKPGPLDENDYDMIATALMESMVTYNKLQFDAIAGIPRAGNPIAEAIERRSKTQSWWFPKNIRYIKLDKEESNGKRKIVPQKGFGYYKDEIVLLVDDLVTKADTKLEAIEAIESSGAIVRDLVVLIDRQQGGSEQLKNAGYNLHSVFTIKSLFDYYFTNNMINAQKYQECIDYIESV